MVRRILRWLANVIRKRFHGGEFNTIISIFVDSIKNHFAATRVLNIMKLINNIKNVYRLFGKPFLNYSRI